MINQNYLILLSFGKSGDTGEGIILADNLAGQFLIKRFNHNELHQISHDCETENVRRT